MITTTVKALSDKDQNYNTEFRLYPKVTREPEFTVQPFEQVNQYTWLATVSGSSGPKFVKINPSTPRISMLEGTEFSVDCYVIDPSNITNPTYDKNIKYTWRRDDSPLYELNKQNKLKGTRSFYISASDCKYDISGIYQLEAQNRYGTTLSEPFEIDVINKDYHPYLFKNLLVNPCGAKGLEGWTADADFKVDEFTATGRSHTSIPIEVYRPQTSPYVEQFNFSLYPNETRLSLWFYETKQYNKNFVATPLAGYNKWIVGNFHPNLVDTDDPGTLNDACFFPSWNYLDSANQNTTLYRLDDIILRSKTYFTRDKLKFVHFGGTAKCSAYQDIDVSEASQLIDGETYGVDKIILHFFAYVGIGMSKYSLTYTDYRGQELTDNTIPVDYLSYISGAYAPEAIKPILIPLYTPGMSSTGSMGTGSNNAGTSTDPSYIEVPDPTCACCDGVGIPGGSSGPLVEIQEGGSLMEISPVADDTTDIRIDFLDDQELLIASQIIKGPDERDIWAVKEKFFIPYYLGNLYSWMIDSTKDEYKIANQRYTTMDAIRGVDDPSSPIKDINAEWVKTYHYPLYDTVTREYGRVNKSDRGAAAMFGISEDLVVPKGTRIIRVNIVFNHKSNVIFDSNPQLKKWTDREIYYDYYTNTIHSDRVYEYGNPRCGVTAMHVSLHPDKVEISPNYNTYKIPLGNVWYKRRSELAINDKFWSVTPKVDDPSLLAYNNVTSDTTYTFGTNLFVGAASTQNQAQLFAQTGATVGNLNTQPGQTTTTTSSASQLGTSNQTNQTAPAITVDSSSRTLSVPNLYSSYQWLLGSLPPGTSPNNPVYSNIRNATASLFTIPPDIQTPYNYKIRVTLYNNTQETSSAVYI